MDNYLLISDAAKEVKVESHVLRYWEEELHLPIKRNELGHRYYTKEDVDRFKQIKGMKERGLQLKAIKMILKDGRLDVLSAPSEEAEEQGQQTVSQQEMPEQKRTQQEMARQMMPRQMFSEENQGIEGTDESNVSGTQVRRNTGELAIDIISGKGRGREVAQEFGEDKSRKLQWLLQQLIRQTLQENNSQLCREIRESVVKELDYQFRMQEEREEARDRMLAERDEEHYKKMDELLRRKSRRLKKEKPENLRENCQDNSASGDSRLSEEQEISGKGVKKKRFFS